MSATARNIRSNHGYLWALCQLWLTNLHELWSRFSVWIETRHDILTFRCSGRTAAPNRLLWCDVRYGDVPKYPTPGTGSYDPATNAAAVSRWDVERPRRDDVRGSQNKQPLRELEFWLCAIRWPHSSFCMGTDRRVEDGCSAGRNRHSGNCTGTAAEEASAACDDIAAETSASDLRGQADGQGNGGRNVRRCRAHYPFCLMLMTVWLKGL